MQTYAANRLPLPPLLLGEGPCYDKKTESLIYVDISGCAVHRYYPATGEHSSTPTGQYVGCAVPFTDGKIAVALTAGIYLLDEHIDGQDRLESFFCRPDSMALTERFNDGKLDPAGRLIVGTVSLYGEHGKPVNHLYSIDPSGHVADLLRDVKIANGFDWSKDGRTLYFTDTMTRRVDAFDYDIESGNISNRRSVLEIPQERGMPDGMCVDEKGMLWLAHWGGGLVARYDPENGEMLARIELPERNATACCFGRNENELFITTASDGALGGAQTPTGGLYITTVDI